MGSRNTHRGARVVWVAVFHGARMTNDDGGKMIMASLGLSHAFGLELPYRIRMFGQPRYAERA
jgi:hypothetical protein